VLHVPFILPSFDCSKCILLSVKNYKDLYFQTPFKSIPRHPWRIFTVQIQGCSILRNVLQHLFETLCSVVMQHGQNRQHVNS